MNGEQNARRPRAVDIPELGHTLFCHATPRSDTEIFTRVTAEERLAMVFGDVIIINFYGVYFLLALPLVRLRARTLAIIASVLAVAGPLLAFGLRLLLTESIMQSINAYDPLERISGVACWIFCSPASTRR